jgi:hypothetical protein
VFGRLGDGHSIEPAADSLDRSASDERPELLTCEAGVRHLAWAEEGAQTARSEKLRRVVGPGSAARFVGTDVCHADIMVDDRAPVNTKRRHSS